MKNMQKRLEFSPGGFDIVKIASEVKIVSEQ